MQSPLYTTALFVLINIRLSYRLGMAALCGKRRNTLQLIIFNPCLSAGCQVSIP